METSYLQLHFIKYKNVTVKVAEPYINCGQLPVNIHL